MRTISVVLGLVGVILVMTNLHARTGMSLALSQRPPAAAVPAGVAHPDVHPGIGVDAPIETIGLDRRARRRFGPGSARRAGRTNARSVGSRRPEAWVRHGHRADQRAYLP